MHQEMPHETYDRLLAVEASARDQFISEAHAEAPLADAASALLLMVLLTVDERSRDVTVDHRLNGLARAALLEAQLFLGVRIFRTIRAARSVLAAGYEPEARAHHRVLLELVAHRNAICDDPTGRQAAAWLSGKKAQGVSASVKAMTEPGLYSRLSHYSHGGPEPVLHLLDTEGQTLFLGPGHSIATRASLLLHAGIAREQAMVISALDGTPLDSPDGFDQQMHNARASLDTDTADLLARRTKDTDQHSQSATYRQQRAAR